MKICKGCSNELSDGVTVCPFCGYNCENDTESNTLKPQQVKKKGKFKGILITVLTLIIAEVIGSHIGEFTAKNMSKSVSEYNQKKDIEEFIEHTKEYAPGHCNGNEYISEEFGFKFTIDENWEFYLDEELEMVSKEMKANAVTSGLAALEHEDISQELLDKFAESIYAAAEMGALYIADDIYVGEVVVGVMRAYGTDSVSIEDYAGGLQERLSENAQVTDEYIAGSTYKVISAEITDVSGINLTVKMYVMIKNDMFCTITCKAMKGYEELFFTAFENAVTAYK